MSATSSSPAASPVSRVAKPRPKNCMECKKMKRKCDKGFPCSECAKTNRTCEYKDPAEDGLFGPINSAKDIHSLAFGTLLDILITRPRVMEAVDQYFAGVNSWFTIVERASFEERLEAAWAKLPAEDSILALCMALIARPPNQRPSKIGDTVYLSTKAILSLVQCKVPMSVPLLQAELLVALYEFSQSMPQQAYLTLGRCLQMTKAFGWHNVEFWSDDRKAAMPRELKLCSILWWAIVYVDCLLHVGYQDQVFPMHTSGLAQVSVIPLPEAFDQHFPGSAPFHGPGFRDANSDRIEGMVLPEATSAWYLSRVLQQLSDPALPGNIDPEVLSNLILQHARDVDSAKWRAGDRNAAFGADLISLMKLNQPGLFSGIDPMSTSDPSHVQAVQRIRIFTDVIHGQAGKLVEQQERLRKGSIAPCAAFAMSYAALLLISHGDGVLQDDQWLMKVENLRSTLEQVSKRWKVAEWYCESVKVALDNRLTGYAP
ncbi:85e784a5-aa62-49f1-8cce-aec5911353d2 [Thermothielavioides terrestris]|uniref:Zn(2)-C6 fungal-type domain-containing protein n=2 Tax=Thermothielavioides terrestris TaxID=2587410 RepID=G2REP2_THETT|nr:uncharacterized protein THITE_2121232 [Thermothielavioides terrestris NRRL 8126]AEO70175.1 hypothetical protein THITE_2121232 [Thermothielavioides terrestris NRRL 8126]SPQ17975.1 85e784a5-aa62-49f1-8cce-aec5911353d2 [Thermothielavioides terrestris]